MSKKLNVAIARVTTQPPHRPTPRAPVGQIRKIAIIGGANNVRYAPFDDLSWELWSHASCRDKCRRAKGTDLCLDCALDMDGVAIDEDYSGDEPGNTFRNADYPFVDNF